MAATTSLSPLGSFARWPYRVGQFLRALRTAVDPEEAQSIVRLLSDAELQLFLAMRSRDRRHAAETMRYAAEIAAEHGAKPSDALLVAALLHDVGKGQLRIEDRVLYVVLRALSLDLVDRFAATEGGRWRLALWRLRAPATLSCAPGSTATPAPKGAASRMSPRP